MLGGGGDISLTNDEVDMCCSVARNIQLNISSSFQWYITKL